MTTPTLYSRHKKFQGLLKFFMILLLLNIPIAFAFHLLRNNAQVQLTMSETFPVYHLGKLIMLSAQFLLSIFGYDSVLLFDKTIYHYGVFSLQISGGVQTFIGFSCLGLGVMWIFASLIIAWPGSVKTKLTYILSGLIIIFLLNVMRMSYLTWVGRDGTNFTSKTVSFFGIGNYDHHDLFNFFIYIVIFILFILWIEVFSKIKTNS